MPDHEAAALKAIADVLENDNWSKGSDDLAKAVLAAARPHLAAAERPREHEWTRCPNCPHPGQPCACSGVSCCEGERSETAAIAEAVYAERERIARLAEQHGAVCARQHGQPLQVTTTGTVTAWDGERLPDVVPFAALIRAEPADREITHQCPPEGDSLMPCCGRTPYDVPRSHRITLDPALVTCKPSVQRTPPAAFGKAAE